jgi:hypothetical protein
MPPLVEGREETAKRGKREPDRGDSSSWRAEVATKVLIERCIRVRRAGGGVAKLAWKMNLEAMDCIATWERPKALRERGIHVAAAACMLPGIRWKAACLQRLAYGL